MCRPTLGCAAARRSDEAIIETHEGEPLMDGVHLGHDRALGLPPRHRLLCVLDQARRLSSVLHAILDDTALGVEDIWIFCRHDDARVDAGLSAYGPALALIRGTHHVKSDGCEYCELLSVAIESGAAVLSMRVGPERVDAIACALEDRGARSIVYGRHWSFTALRSEHAADQRG
jgi:hypothetical protein